MKIVDLPAFLALPAGTVYAKYQPCIFGELNIKGRSVPAGSPLTWYYQDLIPWFAGDQDSVSHLDRLDAIAAGEPSPPLDYDNEVKDGLYDEGQLFAIFERKDVLALIARLQKALADSGVDVPFFRLEDNNPAVIIRSLNGVEERGRMVGGMFEAFV